MLAVGMLVSGCALERTPELQENTRALNGIPLPPRLPGEELDEDRFGMGVEDGPMTPMQSGGMQCGGIFCPFVVPPIEQCCTDADDVERSTARNEDRCGLSFAKVGGATFGDGCWQRDQGGVIDDKCPPMVAPDGATVLEPGCCSDQGFCGTINTESAVGCHYSDGEEMGRCVEEVDPEHSCDPLGVFGARIAVDVAWGGRDGGLVGLTDDGRAELTVHLRIEVKEVDDKLEVTGSARPCSVDLPQFFSTTLCESYKPIFPNTIWESSELPPIDLTGRYSCLNPGCSLTIDAVTSLIGMSLENPEAPWPTPKDTPVIECPEGKGVDCFVDHDDDMLPGLTINVNTTGRVPENEAPDTTCTYYDYWGAPLSASAGALTKVVRRTDRIHLGTRTKLGGTSVLGDACMTGLGTGIAEFVQSRAWGCMVQEGTTDDPFDMTGAGPNDVCDAAEAAFMDENLPIYEVLSVGESPTPPISVPDMSPSDGPKIQLVRLGDVGAPVDCETVRNAPYPR